MNRSDLRISRWLMGIEALVCFAPLTLLWLAAMLNLRRLLAEPGIVVASAIATVAPVALFLALRYVVLGRRLHTYTQYGLAAGFGLIGILQLAAMVAVQGPKLFWFQGEWGIILLCSILPVLCCLHLAQLAREPAPAAG